VKKVFTNIVMIGMLLSTHASMALAPRIPQRPIQELPSTLSNELGADYLKEYISDLNTFWNFATAYYYRLSPHVKYGARVNYYNKFDTSAEQYQIEAYPQFTKNVYADLELAYAKKSQTNFPSLQYLAHVYMNHENIEISIGQACRIFSMFEYQKFNSYIGSIGVYFGNYFTWARIDHVTPQNANLYSIGLTKYLPDRYNYVTLRANAGKILDIGDLPPLDQKVIATQWGINLYGQYNIVSTLYAKLGLAYTSLNYPALKRNISDMLIGVLWRFD
jgi:YaiO family outer membrane protein